MKIKENLTRKNRRQIKKLKHSKGYLIFLSSLFFLFSPMKKFIILPVKWFQKVFGIISFSILKFFWYKIGLIDDFIIHKKLRWRGEAQKLFSKAEEELEKNEVEYMFLTTGNKRKASHRFYKKVWLTLVSFGVGYLAYKKIKQRKK